MRFLGYWNKTLGVLGAAGACLSFVMTITIIPFMPDGWAASAGGFPAMTGNVPFLMKDVVLLAASFFLLKQDTARLVCAIADRERAREPIAIRPREVEGRSRGATGSDRRPAGAR